MYDPRQHPRNPDGRFRDVNNNAPSIIEPAPPSEDAQRDIRLIEDLIPGSHVARQVGFTVDGQSQAAYVLDARLDPEDMENPEETMSAMSEGFDNTMIFDPNPNGFNWEQMSEQQVSDLIANPNHPAPAPTPVPDLAPIPEPESEPSPEPMHISVDTKTGAATLTNTDGSQRQLPAHTAGKPQPTSLHPMLDQYRTLPPRTHFNGMTPQDVNPMYRQEVEAIMRRASRPHKYRLVYTAYNPWRCNCQRACVTAELRMRGYAVTAVGYGRRMSDGHLYDIADMFQTKDGRKRRFSDKFKNTERMSKAMFAKYPVGSRFLVSSPRHVWNAEIVADNTTPSGKRLVYYDMQRPPIQETYTGTKWASYFSPEKGTPVDGDSGRTEFYSKELHSLQYLRVDDMEPSDRILDGGPDGVPYCEPANQPQKWTKGALSHVVQQHDLLSRQLKTAKYLERSVD